MAGNGRHPVSRVRAVIAAGDLFFPKKSVRSRKRKPRKFLNNTVNVFAIYPSRRALVGKPLKGMVRTSWRGKKTYVASRFLEDKQTVFHEFAHFFGLGKNHLLTANCFSGYFSAIKKPCVVRGYPFRAMLKDFEFVIKSGKKLSEDGFEHNDSGIGHLGSIAPIGKYFGVFAARLEKRWKKPSAGLFLVREACNGKPVKEAIADIESGKLDSEIAAFARKHYKNLQEDYFPAIAQT